MKTSKEIITEMVDIIAEAMSDQTGANGIMLKPAINVVKLKLSNLTEKDSDEIIDKVHWLSNHIERETGKLSPYHGLDDI